MMRRKAFWLRIEIEVHSAHSDDVKLYHSGNVALRVHTLSSVAVTKPTWPSFPIHFHEKLIFGKVIDCVSPLAEIQDHLNKEPVKIELVQWPRCYLDKPRTISQFRTELSSLLFPALITNNLPHGGDIKIFMEPSDNFGDVGIEISTKLIIADTTSYRTIRMPELDIISSKNQVIPNKSYTCCRHSTCQFPDCGCLSTDHCRRKPRSRKGKHNNACVHETTSCNNCCICKRYSGYFDPKPYLGYRSRSCSCVKTCCDFRKSKTRRNSRPTPSSSLSSLGSNTQNSKFTSDELDNPKSHRQLFYENLELFYRKLRDKKINQSK